MTANQSAKNHAEVWVRVPVKCRFRSAVSRLLVLGFAALGAGSGGVWAQTSGTSAAGSTTSAAGPNITVTSPGALPTARPSLTPDKQAEYYRRSVENLSLQAKYIIDKVDRLQDAAAVGNVGLQRQILGNFCIAIQESDSTPSGLNQCTRRYVQYHVLQLYRIRSAIVMNSSSEARLAGRTTNDQAAPSQAPAYQIPRPEGATREARVFYLPTIDEIRRDDARMQYLNSEQYREWARSLPREPSPDDFVKFKRIPRDPNRPGAGTFLVVETDEQGAPVRDQQAYQAARQRFLTQAAGYDAVVSRIEQSPHDLNKETTHLENLPPSNLTQIYNDSRRDVIGVINDSIVGTRSRAGLPTGRTANGRTPATRPSGTAGTGASSTASTTTTATIPGVSSTPVPIPIRTPASGREQVQVPPVSNRDEDFSATYNPEDIQRAIDQQLGP